MSDLRGRQHDAAQAATVARGERVQPVRVSAQQLDADDDRRARRPIGGRRTVALEIGERRRHRVKVERGQHQQARGVGGRSGRGVVCVVCVVCVRARHRPALPLE